MKNEGCNSNWEKGPGERGLLQIQISVKREAEGSSGRMIITTIIIMSIIIIGHDI